MLDACTQGLIAALKKSATISIPSQALEGRTSQE